MARQLRNIGQHTCSICRCLFSDIFSLLLRKLSAPYYKPNMAPCHVVANQESGGVDEKCTSILPYFPFARVSIRNVASIKENSRVARLDQHHAVTTERSQSDKTIFERLKLYPVLKVIPRAHLFVKIKFSWKSTLTHFCIY